MRILWLSNISILSWQNNKSGTWIYSMFETLQNYPMVRIIGNVTLGGGKTVKRVESKGFQEYYLPSKWIEENGYPKKTAIEEVRKIIDSLTPDIIHIWGLELCWGIICSQFDVSSPILIDIQGLKGVISSPIYFTGGLQNPQKSTAGFLERLFPRYSYNSFLKVFKYWQTIERTVLHRTRFINTQSNWVRQILKSDGAIRAKIFHTDIILRNEFITCTTWDKVHRFQANQVQLFCLSASRIYKGVHIAIEALAIVRNKYPNVKLRIAGIGRSRNNLTTSGYVKFLLRLIKRFDLESNVEFLGNIKTEQIIDELQKCDVCVNPSFVETYCLSLAESLAVGVPCVASYTSALPELIENDYNGLLFPLGDVFVCAQQILKLLDNQRLSLEVSQNASERQRKRNNPLEIARHQVDIYTEILEIAGRQH